MFAAIAAAERGHEVVLLEKNEKLGKKLYITGKGRCNITNAGDMDTLFANVMTNPKFLYSAFYDYDNQRVIDFFEENGLATKVERGNRVFPVSDHSSDVIATLQRVLKRTGVMVQLHAEVRQILTGEGAVRGVKLADGSVLEAERVILATGGFSYQTTGRRRRLSFCKGTRTYGDKDYAVTGSVLREGDLRGEDAGAGAEKCAGAHPGRKKAVV